MEQFLHIVEHPEQSLTLSLPTIPASSSESVQIPVAILPAMLAGQRNETEGTFPLAFVGEGSDRQLLPENFVYGLEYSKGQVAKFDHLRGRIFSPEKTIMTLETPAVWMAGLPTSFLRDTVISL